MTNPYLDLLSSEDEKAASAATAAPAAKTNPYLATLQSVADEEDTRLKQRIHEAARTNPEQAAKAATLGKKLEIPVDIVARNLVDVQLQDAVNTYDKKLQTSPKLLRAVRDVPNFMNQVHDDLDNASLLEKNINEFKRGLSGTLRGFDVQSAISAMEMLGAVDAEAGQPVDAERAERRAIYQRQQQVLSGLTPEQQDARRAQAGVQLRQNMQDQIATNLAEAAVRERAISKLPVDPALKEFQSQAELGPALAALTRSPVGIATQIVSGSMGGMLPSIPVIAAGTVFGGPVGLAAATGVTSAATEYVNNLPDIFKQMKVDLTNADAVAAAIRSQEFRELSRQALTKAGVIGVFDAATAGVAGKVLAKTPLRNLAAQTGVQMAGGGAGEAVGSLASGQEVSASAVLSEMIGEIPSAVTDVGMIAVKRAVEGQQQVALAHENNVKLQELFTLAAESKLRTRNPDTFQQFVQQMGDEEGVSEIYIDANTLQQTLQQAGVTDEKFAELLPSVVPQMAEALQAGGAVAIPIGELTARLTGTGLEQQLLPHLREDAEALSHAEAEAATEQSAVYMQQEAQRVLAEATDIQATLESAERVRETVLNQLAVGKRFRPDVNAAYATFIRDFYTATSGRLGITPEAMYAKYPLRVIAESPVAGEAVLEQPEGLTTAVSTEPIARSKADQEILDLVTPPGPNDTTIRAVIDGKEVGYLDLAVGADGVTAEVRDVRVTPEQRRKGIATALYNAAIARGYNVQRSQFQTEEGAAFREAFDAQQPQTPQQIEAQGAVNAAQRTEQLAASPADASAAEQQFERDIAVITDEAPVGELPQQGRIRGGTGLLADAPVPDLGADTPLAGLPATVKVNGQDVTFGPHAPAREAARRYAERAGLPYNPPSTYVKVDEKRAKLIADAFEAMVHDPADSAVKASYDAMIRETIAQWQAIKETGLVVEFITGDDPYGNPRNAILDVVENNHLWVYPTSAGFGGTESLGIDISGNPLLAVVPGEEISGRPVQANDIFRIVHDYFGHIKEGVGFRAEGEENAWRSHWAMYSPLARQAMTTETRGQNSWVNFGPFTEFNKTAGPAETQYAPQKIGLLPSWVVEEGATDTGGVLTQASPAPTIGIHFSKQPRKALDGRYYGSGLKGLEAERLRETTDQRLKERVYVYVDEGSGVRPESGVGGFAHEVPLPALYDAKADPLKLWKGGDLNATESRILDAGYGGYFIRNVFSNQGAAVVLGPQSRGIAVAEIPVPGYIPPAPAAPAVYRRGLMSAELAALDIEQIRAIAPSATVKGGTFQVSEADLPAAQAAAAAQGVNLPGMVLTQPRGAAAAPGGPRATFNPKTLTINLLQTADLSSFLHESAHFFLEVMADIATQPDAPAAVASDMGTVLKWFGVTDMFEWNTRTLDQKRPFHEKFAESFEQYLFEGKAPSAELQAVFNKFRSWMMTVYKSIKDIFQQSNGGLSNEVREVFDRLLATQDQIAEKQRLAGYTMVYQSAEQAGMTPEEWATYQQQDETATSEAMDALQARTLRDLRWTINARSKELKRLQGDVDDQRKTMRDEVKAEVRQQPVYAVQRWLKTGVMPDGEKTTGGKLSTKVLREMFGDGPAAPWRYLATNMITADELGLHPNMVAELFGFATGDAMVRAIVGAFPEDQTIDGMTDARLLETYGDTVTEAGMKRAAEEAILNEARARFMATGLKAISQAQTPAKVLLKAAKMFAQNIVSRRKIMDLKPSVFTGAGARAAKRLAEATAASDTQAAVSAQRDQLLNHYAAKYTMETQAEVAKALEYLRKFDKESARKAIPIDYLDQIDDMLQRFDLRTSTTLREISKRKSLAAWVAEQEEMGLSPVIPEGLLEEARSISYKELTVEEFRGIVDSVKNIEHLGRLKGKLLKAKDKREFALIVGEIEQSIRDNATKTREVRVNAPTAKDRAADFARGFFSSHRKLSSLVRQLDGFKDGGPFWQVFTRAMNEAGDQEAVMRAKATEELAKIFTPFLKNNKLSEMAEIPSIRKALSLETRLAVALNSGNAANKQRVMDGDKWSEAQLNDVLSTLTQEQLQFVQKVWDNIDKYWPDIKAKEERISGVAPEKVAAEPLLVKAADGQMVELRGGYYPIKYDPDRSSRAEADTAAELTKQMLQGQYTRATTRRGHTKARAETVNRTVRKDIGVVFQHVDQVIHDLAWHEWLIDANRLVRSNPIESAIRETVGPEVLREFKKAIEDIAAGDVPAQSEFERGINHVRQGATIVGLGWNVMTSLMQPLGLTQSMVRIGPRWVGKGLARWVGDAARMEGGVKEVYEKSDFMRSRAQTVNREINEIRNKVQGAKLTALEETYFYLIQKMQIVADMPTWLGQYEKAYATSSITDPTALEADAIAQADQAVRDAQGSGMTGDLARIQRGGPLQKLFTSFYSYFSTTYNLTAERYNMTSFRNPLQIGRFAVDMLLLYVLPSVLVTLMKEALTGKDDDEDKLLEKVARDQLNYLLGSMVGLREAGAAINGFTGYQGPAGTRFFSELAKLGKQIEQGEIDKALLKAVSNTGGILFHFPAGQVNRTVEGFLALKEGETSNPLALLFGPPR